MIRNAFFFLALLTTLPTSLAGPRDGQPTDTDLKGLSDRIQTTLDDLRSKAKFPGVSVGVVLADGRSAGVVSGLADVENKVALKPTDRLLSGSVGKMFVAAVVLQMVDEGKIGLDDRVAKWLGQEPWFGRLPNAQDMTVRSLLNHTAGVPEYFEQKGFEKAMKADPDKEWTPAERLAYVLDVKPAFAVGKGWAYSDTHFILAGLVVEKAGGKPLFAEIDRRLLKPLKLTGIVASDKRTVPGLANGYASPRNPLGFDGPTIVGGKLITNPQIEWAGGGLATTPEDLARGVKALCEGTLFKPETYKAMLTGIDTPGGRGGGKGSKYGLGVMIRETEWGPSYGHGGWFPGYRTEVMYFAEKKVAIAIQFNTDAGASLGKGVSAYISDIARIVIGPAK